MVRRKNHDMVPRKKVGESPPQVRAKAWTESLSGGGTPGGKAAADDQRYYAASSASGFGQHLPTRCYRWWRAIHHQDTIFGNVVLEPRKGRSGGRRPDVHESEVGS